MSSGAVQIQVWENFAPGATLSRRAWVLPVLVIDPWELDGPEEDWVGTSPTNAPMVAP